MTEVIPAFIVQDFNDLSENITKVVSLVSFVQIDVCDGKFAQSISWPMQMKDKSSVEKILDEEEGLPFWDSIDYEFDLMILNAIDQFDFFIRLGAKRIIFHLESEDKDKLKEFLEGIDMYTRENIEIGIAINTTTSIDLLRPIISHVDFVQCMGVENIGYQGEPFDDRVITQISSLKNDYPEIVISVDGSVNEDTAPLLVEAGASRLVVGSALLNCYDIRETIKELENL